MILLMKRSPRKSKASSLSLTRVTRSIYFLIGFYILSIAMFDSGNLITREAVIDRSTLAFVLLVLNTAAWYVASDKKIKSKNLPVYVLTLGLLAFAGFSTYWERGMASPSTILYALPLLSVATLKNRHALIATAALAIGIYAFSAIKYFNDFFNEGFRIQLWGQIALYSGVILTMTWLIMIIADLRHDSR